MGYPSICYIVVKYSQTNAHFNPISSFRYGVWYSDDTAEVLPTCKPIVCNHPVIANGALETGESVRYVHTYGLAK